MDREPKIDLMTSEHPKPGLRWTAILLLTVFGLVLVAASLLVPTHLRAIDEAVVVRKGLGTETLVDAGLEELQTNRIGLARLYLKGAEMVGLEAAVHLQRLVSNAAEWQRGQEGVTPLGLILRDDPWALQWDGPSVVRMLAPAQSRARLREHLAGAYRSGVLDLLQTRELEKLTFFSPADDSSGPPYETACLVSALLVQNERLPDSLRQDIGSLAYQALRNGQTQPLELFYLDLISLGNRMNWGQLVGFLGAVPSVGVLHDAVNLIRREKEAWPRLAAVMLHHGSAKAVSRYLMGHAQTGREDLWFAARHGRGGVEALVKTDLRVYHPFWRAPLQQFPPFFAVSTTWLRVSSDSRTWGLILRYTLLLLATFMLARAVIDLMPVAEGIAVKRWASPAHLAVFGALSILVVALFEPFLFEQAKTLNFPLQWKLPMLGEGIRETISENLEPIMEILTILALVFFLVLQGIIYLICLLKLADIRRQPVPSETKLRLLENEENMFDAGLYCGLGGTVASLVLLAMGIFEASLMAAYASTLFGIIFVAILKICHLRPFRRRLILESEA